MACRTGKLPQWWLDNTPHDTLEEQVERRVKEEEERRAQEADASEECAYDGFNDVTDDAARPQEAPMETLEMNGKVNGDAKTASVSRTNGYKRNSNPSSYLLRPPDEYESTDYKVERAKLRHVSENDKNSNNNKRNGVLSPSSPEISATSSPFMWSSDADSPQEQSLLPESAPSDVLSPESTAGTPSSLTSTQKPIRSFKTAFTGVSPFDFAMQQRAREQERREKERLARESLRAHNAAKVEKDRASQQKQKDLEEKRKKKEAEDALKNFKKTSLESDLETELTRRRQEDKRKKKEAEEQHHIYKATS